MKTLKKSFALLLLVTLISGSPTSAQDSLFNPYANEQAKQLEKVKLERAKEVKQDNEYSSTGFEKGNFFSNPLVLNGKPLDYSEFSLRSTGELTLIKGSVITGDTTQVPFYVYLRRNGTKILIPGKEKADPKQIKVDISEVFKHAEPGDHLIVEAVRKEDGPVKRILKLIGGGC
jgi:hypothetical protein